MDIDIDITLNEHQTKSILQRISNILLINGGFFDNPGLYTGEMGLAVFFFHYAEFTQNELYLDFSFDLIEKVQNKIHNETPIDYRHGLSGIGSAIEYLVQWGFMEVDTDDMLEEFDKRIFSADNMPDMSVEELSGIAYYSVWRMAGNSAQTHTILKKVLPRLVHFMDERCRNLDVEYRTVTFLKDIVETENLGMLSDMSIVFRPCRNRYPYGLEINTYNHYLEQFSKNDCFNTKTLDLSLHNGLAGFGMALMTEINVDNAWISLFPKDFFCLP